ncbi:transketolase C-terminal domain-containing protein, partial [Planctomycetota bacterium]
GPTHQPVEHAASLRAMPNMLTFRPGDANETAQTWKYVLTHADAPAALCLTRQGLPTLDATKYDINAGVTKGAYVLVKQDKPDVLLLATGSEVSLALEAGERLAFEGVKAQVVSMPCWELFEKQDQAYKDGVLPPACEARVGVEAGVEQGWYKWLGLKGEFVGMKSFGASGPAAICFEKFGINTDSVVSAAKQSMSK